MAPDDALYSQQIHLERLNLPAAWDVVKGQDGDVVIAIVDGGTNWMHEDLVDNIWTNTNEIDGNGIDDDGNGYIDDVYGWNFGSHIPDPTGPPDSDNALHGTAVAGAAAARTNNGIGIAGSSWNARYMALSVSCPDQFSICGAEEAVTYAALNGADVINASWGGRFYSEILLQVIEAARAEGALVVAAAGNETIDSDIFPSYPANYPPVLNVGAIEKDSDINVFNYGKSVHVYAAGESVDVTMPASPIYDVLNGTSFSTPLVAGVAALVKTAFPSYGPDQIREQLRQTAVNIDAANPGLEGKMGAGRVDAHAAVTAAPIPAIRVQSWSVKNQNGESELRDDDTATLEVTFVNYLGDGDNISVEMMTDASYITWQTKNAMLGTMKRGDTVTEIFEFSVDKAAPLGSTLGSALRLSPQIAVGSMVDAPDILRITVNEALVADHLTNALQVSVTEEGNLGFTTNGYDFRTQGNGFVALDDSYDHSLLYEGGLMIGTSSDQVMDCITEDDGVAQIWNIPQQQDFVPADGGIGLEILQPGISTSQEGRVTISDAGAMNPIGLEVFQESYVQNTPEYEDILLLKYTVSNRSGGMIEDLHVGLYMNWDVGDFILEDSTGFDPTRRIGYILSSEDTINRVVGTRLLTDGDLHYAALDYYVAFNNLGLDSALKWEMLSGGVRDGGVIDGKGDVFQVTSSGPFTLSDGGSVEVAFALFSGSSLDDFFINADNAQLLWQTVNTSTDEDESTLANGPWELHSPYPNPATGPIDLGFQIGSASDVQLEIYDLLGRRVRTVLDGQRPEGKHTVTWDGQNDVGMRVAAGLYMVRMKARSNKKTYTNSQPLVLVR